MMTARVFAAALLALLSAAATSAHAGSYAYFDRPEPVSPNSHAAVSNDIYVRSFGWAWGEVRFGQDNSPAQADDERQARETMSDPRDAMPGRQEDSSPRQRHPRGKISMNLAAAPADDGPAIVTAPRTRATVR